MNARIDRRRAPGPGRTHGGSTRRARKRFLIRPSALRLNLQANEDRATDDVVVVDVVAAKMRRVWRLLVGEVRAAHEKLQARERALAHIEGRLDGNLERAVEIPEVSKGPRRRVVVVPAHVAAKKRNRVRRIGSPSDGSSRLNPRGKNAVPFGTRKPIDVR